MSSSTDAAFGADKGAGGGGGGGAKKGPQAPANKGGVAGTSV